MEFGITAQLHPPAAQSLEIIKRAEAEGWDFVNVTDAVQGLHPRGLIPDDVAPAQDPTIPLGAFANSFLGSYELVTAASVLTERIGVKLAVVDAVRRSPAVIAQELLSISHLSKGRNSWAFGSGEAGNFEPYGDSRGSKPIGRMIESLRIMHALWDSGGEPVSFDGEFWTLKDAVLPLQPYNGGKPRTLVVGGGPKLTHLAGELCDGWLTYLPGGIENDIRMLTDMISQIKRIAAAAGRDPESLEFGAMAMVCLAETDEAAWQLARSPGVAWLGIAAGAIDTAKAWEKWGHEHPLGKDYVWSQKGDRTGWQTADAARALAPAVPDEVTDNTVIWGGPAKVADRLQQFIDAGLTQMSFMNCGPWGDVRSGLVWSECISEVITRLGHKPLNLTVAS